MAKFFSGVILVSDIPFLCRSCGNCYQSGGIKMLVSISIRVQADKKPALRVDPQSFLSTTLGPRQKGQHFTNIS